MNYKKLAALYESGTGKYANAKKMGRTYQSIQGIIRKESDLKVSTLEKIAHFYNVPVGYFFDEAEADGQQAKDVEIARLEGKIEALERIIEDFRLTVIKD